MAEGIVTRSTDTGGRVGALAAPLPARWLNPRVMLAFAASAALAVAGFTIVLGAFYPGLMSPDSLHQLHQALTGQFETAHPPIMAWTWSVLMALGGGVGSLLTLHNGIFFSGLLGLATYLIVRGRPVVGVMMMCIAFTPPLLALLGVVWKDIGMGAALLLMTATMLWAQALKSRWLWMLSLVPGFYAIAVRHNGFLAVAPMLWLWCPSPEKAKMVGRRLGCVVVLSLGMFGINAGAVRLFATRNDDALVYIQAMYDLIGIAANGGTVQWPDYVIRESNGKPEDFVAKYSDVTFYASPCPYPNGQVEFGELKKTWVRSILDHPGPYVVHRLRVFRNVIGLGKKAAYEGTYRGVVGGPDNVTFEPNGIYWRVMQYVEAYSDSLFYRPVVWLAVAVAALWLSWKRRLAHRDLATCLVASAVLYTAPNLIVICGTDFRYMWWPTLALMITPLIVLSDALPRTQPGAVDLNEKLRAVVGGTSAPQDHAV